MSKVTLQVTDPSRLAAYGFSRVGDAWEYTESNVHISVDSNGVVGVSHQDTTRALEVLFGLNADGLLEHQLMKGDDEYETA